MILNVCLFLVKLVLALSELFEALRLIS